MAFYTHLVSEGHLWPIPMVTTMMMLLKTMIIHDDKNDIP